MRLMSLDIEDESRAVASGTLSGKVQTEDQHIQEIRFVQDILFQIMTDKLFDTWCFSLGKCDQSCSFGEGQSGSICKELSCDLIILSSDGTSVSHLY